jgi:hypothetical protein
MVQHRAVHFGPAQPILLLDDLRRRLGRRISERAEGIIDALRGIRAVREAVGLEKLSFAPEKGSEPCEVAFGASSGSAAKLTRTPPAFGVMSPPPPLNASEIAFSIAPDTA